ncbi:ECF RNA polymerase sigma factor SigE [Thalassocella blandensis]|nr:ECF RNA polymerase sigma factor SigE [Thalassocella blandensis]
MRTDSQLMSDANQTKVSQELNIEKLVLEHGQTIKQFIYRKLWNKQNVEDVFQTVILEAIKSSHTFNGECHPKYWLMGIASNVIKNSARKENAVFFPIEASDGHNIIDEMSQEWVEDPADTYEQEIFLNEIEDAYSNLPEEMKSVMFEVVNNGKSYADTANELNIAIGTVRSRVSRARDFMRTRVNFH